MTDPRDLGARCDQCVLCHARKLFPAPVQSDFVIVTDAPTEHDAARGDFVSGPAGRMLDAALTRAGVSRSAAHTTAVVLCVPDDNDLATAVKATKAENKRRLKTYKDEVAAVTKLNKQIDKDAKREQRLGVQVARANEAAEKKFQQAVLRHAKELEAYNKRHARERARVEKVGGTYVPSGESPPVPPTPPTLLAARAPSTTPHVRLESPPVPELLLTPTECCAPRLARELVDAKTVLMLGKNAMEAVMEREVAILDEQGFPAKLPGGKHGVGVLHPGALLGGMEQYKGAFMLWVERAVRMWRDGLTLMTDPSPYYTAKRVNLVLKEVLRLANERRAAGLAPLDVAIDVETDGLDTSACNLRCVGVAFGDVTAVVAVRTIAGDLVTDPVAFATLQKVLQHPHVRKIFHNGMYDIPVVERAVGPIAEPMHDTLLLHHSIESEVPHSLSFVSSLLLDAPSWKSLGDGTHGLSVQDDKQLWLYNSVDVSRTVKIVKPLEKMIEQDGLQAVADTASKLLPILARMGGRGLLVDEEKRQEIKTRLEREHARCVAEMKAILQEADPILAADYQFTKPSHRDCAWEVLGIGAHLDKTDKAGTYKSTADDLMRALPQLDARARAFIGVKFGPGNAGSGYLGAQSTAKAVSTFCEVEASPDGRLRSSWKIHGTPTGRLSSAGPNLQNIPEWLRAMYKPMVGNVFVAADYSALELWIVAIYSQAANLLTALQAADVHRVNTEALFNLKFADKLGEAASTGCAKHGTIPPSCFDLIDAGKKFKCDWHAESIGCPDCILAAQAAFDTTVDRLAKLRGQSKRFVYAGNYGGSENTIWMKLLVEFPSLRLEDVMYLSQQWKKVNPQISATAHASEQLYYRRRLQHGVGWLESPILGRRRYWTGKEFGPTDAANYPIQSAAADIVNGALIALNADAIALGGLLVAQVHDSLVYEVPEHNAEKLKALLEQRMPGEYRFIGRPGIWSFPVEAKIGTNWSEV